MNELLSVYVVYDTSVWTEFGYTVQRYIANATMAGIKILAPIAGLGLVFYLIHRLAGTNK